VAYDIDFGWGRPGRVELVSMNFDGELSVCWYGERFSTGAAKTI
jgi:hypothetical protein